jgi:manganese efflux pump family protein
VVPGMLRVLGFVLPLSLDSFAAALAAMGIPGLRRVQRLRITALFLAFEAGMPLVGLALGASVAGLAGGLARFVVPVALAAVGIWILRESLDDDDDDARKARGLLTARGFAIIGLGLGISLDELALGFTISFTRLPVAEVVTAIAVQASVAIWGGACLGSRLRGTGARRVRWGAEVLAGAGLLGLAVFLTARTLS